MGLNADAPRRTTPPALRLGETVSMAQAGLPFRHGGLTAVAAGSCWNQRVASFIAGEKEGCGGGPNV